MLHAQSRLHQKVKNLTTYNIAFMFLFKVSKRAHQQQAHSARFLNIKNEISQLNIELQEIWRMV